MIEQLFPPTIPTVDEGPHQKYLFLAGPIQGAADWQEEAYRELERLWKPTDGVLSICNPRRKDDTWQFDYAKQVDWESYCLSLAAQQGVVIFWLAKEAKHDCGRAFAQTTRFELGEWLAKTPDTVVVGIEEGFTGAKYVRHRMQDTKVYESLADVCRAAIDLLHGGKPVVAPPEEKLVPFIIDALNPKTGKKDGIQYTFGGSHVAQALACYADAAGKLGAIKNTLGHYEEGLRLLSELPQNLPTRNTLFRTWKTHWEAQFEDFLQGKAKTYLFNLLASKYRSYLNPETSH